MNLLEGSNLLYAVLILVGLGVAWIILKFLLRFTMRFFACGCISILALGAIVWLIFR
jgi:hypothetical protein